MGGWKADGLVWGWVRYQRCYPIVRKRSLWRGPAGWPGAPLGSGQGGRGEGVEDRQPSGVEEEQEGGED